MNGIALLVAAAIFYWAFNAKGLPFTHSAQLLPSLYRLIRPRLFQSKSLNRKETPPDLPSVAFASPKLFEPHCTKSRAVLADLDVNIHKSNSTFFADADINRATLLTSLLGEGLARVGPAIPILAATQAHFRREIKPYQVYWISSRILTWNERSLYTVTYFLRENSPLVPIEVDACGGGPMAVIQNEQFKHRVLALLVTKYVFKSGRRTVAPEDVLLASGLFPTSTAGLGGNGNAEPQTQHSGAWTLEAVRETTIRGMEYVRHGLV